jgi:transcriptional regulator with XRE-family HTH domain
MENKEAFLNKIGANIREIRKSKKQEPKEVAKGLGISVQAYGQIENGGTDLNISRLFEIAKFFDVSFTQVLKVNEGDVFNYSSQNNSGGYHVLNNGVINITDDKLREHLQNENAELRQKLAINEALLKKVK